MENNFLNKNFHVRYIIIQLTIFDISNNNNHLSSHEKNIIKK